MLWKLKLNKQFKKFITDLTPLPTFCLFIDYVDKLKWNV